MPACALHALCNGGTYLSNTKLIITQEENEGGSAEGGGYFEDRNGGLTGGQVLFYLVAVLLRNIKMRNYRYPVLGLFTEGEEELLNTCVN